MDDKVKGLELLTDTILHNKRHQDYKRVVDLATEYYDIFTGQNVNKYLKRIVRREDEQAFEQRCLIYQTTIPASVENLQQLFNKPLRSNRIFKSIEHGNSNARNEITDRMDSFYQGESERGVDAYLQERWKDMCVYDPNGYICVEFGDFNPYKTKPFPFPLEYSSEQAINMEYKNGSLQWIIMKLPHEYRTSQDKPKEKEAGSKYIMYLDNTAIVLTQVHKDKRITDLPNPEFHEIREEGTNTIQGVYVLQYFELKSNGIPCFRAGYKKDPATKGRTVVSTIHYALAFYKKELKTGSEFDITMSMHAFPIRIMYGKRCEGDKEKGAVCKNGLDANGKPCKSCGGSQVVAHIATSAMEVQYVLPPKPGETALDLEKAFVYKTPPEGFIKFMEEYLERLTQKAKGAVFAAEVVQKKQQVEQTATEMDYSYDNVYDTYFPFGQKYSYAWKFIVRQIAVYTDNYDSSLLLYHQFPKDFKLKGLDVLLNEAKLAKDSGLSQHAINAINNDVLEALYADDQDTLVKIKVRERFHPFSGKSTGEVASLLMTGEILPYYKTLYTYFGIIFNAIDNEMGDKFYLMTYENQKKEIDKRVAEIQGKVDALQAKTLKDMLKNGGQEEEEGQ